ncbi:MAG: hypothetical protein ACYDHY_06715 [Acidiferrobacterales bacterium]
MKMTYRGVEFQFDEGTEFDGHVFGGTVEKPIYRVIGPKGKIYGISKEDVLATVKIQIDTVVN